MGIQCYDYYLIIICDKNKTNTSQQGSGFGKKNGSEAAVHLKRMKIIKSQLNEYLDNFKSLLFCFHTFISDVPYQPGSGSRGLARAYRGCLTPTKKA